MVGTYGRLDLGRRLSVILENREGCSAPGGHSKWQRQLDVTYFLTLCRRLQRTVPVFTVTVNISISHSVSSILRSGIHCQ